MISTIVNTIGFLIKAKMVLNRVIILTKVTIRIRTFLSFPNVATSLTKIRNALDIIKEFVKTIITLVNVIKYIYTYVAHRTRN